MVPVDAADTGVDKRLAAVVGDVKRDAEDVDALVVVRVHANLPVIERPRHQVVELLPALALVVGTEDAALVDVGGVGLRHLAAVVHRAVGLVGLHDGVDDARVLAVDRDAAAAERAVGQPRGHFLPCLAAVRGLAETGVRPPLRFRAAAGERVAPHRVGRGVQGFRIGGVHRQVDETGVLVDELDTGPRLAAIISLEQAALLVRTPHVSESGDVNDLRILRVHDDTADVARLFEAHVRPRLAAVDGLVDAVAP